MKFSELSLPSLPEEIAQYKFEMDNFYQLSHILPILSRYTCPSSCNNHCCKILNPSVTILDIQKISTSLPTSLPTCSNLNVLPNTLISLGSPCAFLTSSCSVYSHRPYPCKVYPFVFRDSLPDNIQLMPCPLGIQIINDIFPTLVSEYLKIHEERGSSIFVKNAFLKSSESLLSSLNSFHTSGKFFKTKQGANIPCLQILKSVLPKL